MIKKILILGGSGYLGKAIADRFILDSSFNVLIGDILPISDSSYTFVQIDVFNKNQLNKYIKDVDLVINCTGQNTIPITKCLELNSYGIDNIVNAIKFYRKKLLQISSVAVYGSCNYADEFSPLNPETPYATCKSFAEYRIKRVLKNNSYCILRLPNLYGGNQTKGLFSYILKSYLTDRILYFNNDGSLKRHFLNIFDCSEAIFMAVRNDLSGIYNIPVLDKYSIKEIVELIEKKINIKFKIFYEPYKPLENIDTLNFDRFIKKTKFKPKIKLSEYIIETFI